MYTVALMTDDGFAEHCRPLAIGVDKAIAKSIRRWYEKNVCVWNDYTQTGQYVLIVSRRYCNNHKYYEVQF